LAHARWILPLSAEQRSAEQPARRIPAGRGGGLWGFLCGALERPRELTSRDAKR
jgi:hypothetical protein